MALQKTIALPSGLAVADAYHRITEVTVRGKNRMTVFVDAFVSADGSVPASSSNYALAYDIAGDNPIKQAYEHLKTLPEFAGAADV